mmetsp:Transcript_27855/g.39144  ORF Transcript_27855/g.39144 Transcript_27855/m.39144 type:complete len:234 (+) Transcript_27855:87-788(+)
MTEEHSLHSSMNNVEKQPVVSPSSSLSSSSKAQPTHPSQQEEQPQEPKNNETPTTNETHNSSSIPSKGTKASNNNTPASNNTHNLNNIRNNNMMLEIPLERLRNELQRLRTTSEKLQQENKVLTETNKRLMMASKQSQELFLGIVDHTKSLKSQNTTLTHQLSQVQGELMHQKMIHQELKEGIAMKNAAYEAEVMLRTECQSILGEVVDVVQETCHDTQLVEDILTKTERLTP